ncbi:hypothetical protein [Atopomonas sediminilitoris]|uniref:hypothetical protein n=1 Tax=Atopomonas sediminilitoris TaxID=2919919 RepID=UPI001F4DACA9|nr:hypothetical protein [Atopomonas sediminilitoris]MCJ8169126.1 hypothetical protein [Atopomonas sediminilitoris]
MLSFDNLLNAAFTALILQIPVIIGGVLHMWVVSYNGWPWLKVPINEQLFGANKTWRGMLLMPLFTALGALCLWPASSAGQLSIFGESLALAGLAAGLGYVLAELPNSWLKRRAGIAPGALPTRHQRWVIAGDQIDSGLGVALAYWLLLDISALQVFMYIVTFPFTALLVKRLLFMARLKRSAV